MVCSHSAGGEKRRVHYTEWRRGKHEEKNRVASLCACMSHTSYLTAKQLSIAPLIWDELPPEVTGGKVGFAAVIHFYYFAFPSFILQWLSQKISVWKIQQQMSYRYFSTIGSENHEKCPFSVYEEILKYFSFSFQISYLRFADGPFY